MKKIYLIALSILFIAPIFSQEEEDSKSDTTRINIGNKEVIFIGHEEEGGEFSMENCDKRSEAHWAGLDFGFTMLMNDQFQNQFDDHPYWNNDAARSQVWNLNILEHKFNIAKHYFGVTTGLGFSFTSVAFKNNYIISSTPDTLTAFIDTVNTFSKNKLKAAYLTVPLLLEFNTNRNAEKSFYLAAGVVGGVRLASKIKRKGEFDGNEFTKKESGRYGLNAFKVDGVVRLGYSHWGAFASYSLLPLFDDGKTVDAYPLTFGLSLNF
ncbi:MAG: PorT family protein [Crocinitomicaceae bacterium]|nr:PorT family protein [Crocinitomicaceae bacterium]